MALELPGVVVAVPDGDLLGGERGGDLLGRAAGDREHERGRAVAGGAVERDVGHRAERVERGGEQGLLVALDGLPVGAEQVVGGRADAGQRLERQRAQLPAVRDGVGRRADLVGLELLQQLGTAAQDPDVRAEPLVGRAREHVGVQLLDVDPAVGRRVHGVDVHAGTGGVGGGDDAGQVGNGADRVGRGGDGDVPRAVGEHGVDGCRRELERLRLRLGEAHGGLRAGGGEQPRRDVGVVVEPRAHDLVAGAQRASGGRREAHREVGHAGAEDDALRVGAEQRRDARARGGDELVGALGGREQAAVVGVVAGAHELRHRLDRAVDHLRAGRTVEPRPAVAQAREPLAVHPVTSRSRSRSCS